MDGGVARLTLNRPAKLNAMNVEMLDLLRFQVDTLAGRGSVACLILSGAGRSSSAGNDFADIPAGDPERIRFEAETIDRLERLPFPMSAQVHGRCLTGAPELV